MTIAGAGDAVAEPAPEPIAEPPMVVHAEPPAGRHRGRTIGATVLGILAVLLLTVTVIAVWARATVLRAEPVAKMAGDAIAQPEVQQALAAYLTEAAANAVDLQGQLTTVLPDALDRFAPAIAAGAQAAVQRAVERVLATPQFEQVVRTVVERAHDRAMRLLEGDGIADGVTVADGTITLNTLPLVTSALTSLQSATGLLSNVKIPQLAADGDPAQQIKQLEQAIGRDLPDGFGQLVVYQSDAVARAQDSVKTAQRLLALAERTLWLLLLATVVLIAASILVAARRGRAVLVLALGTTAALVIVRSAVRTVVDAAPDLTDQPGAKAAIRAVLGDARQSFLHVTGVVLLLAVVAVIVTVLIRRWQRGDLVLVAAVVLGALTTAAIGVGSWGLLAGLVVGIAVPFVVNWVWKQRPPAAPAAGTPDPLVAPSSAT